MATLTADCNADFADWLKNDKRLIISAAGKAEQAVTNGGNNTQDTSFLLSYTEA